MNVWKGAVVAAVLGLVGFLALSRPAVRNTAVIQPEVSEEEPMPQPQPTPEPGSQSGGGTLAASWRGDCNNSSTKTSGGVNLDYDGDTHNVNGEVSGTQTVRWDVKQGELDRVEVYVEGILTDRSTESSGSVTRDVTQGCLTAVLVYTK